MSEWLSPWEINQIPNKNFISDISVKILQEVFQVIVVLNALAEVNCITSYRRPVAFY